VTAGRLDITVETGAHWARVIVHERPDTLIRVDEVVAGQRIFVDGRGVLVHSVTPAPGGRTILALGYGLMSDPAIIAMSDANVAPAIPMELLDVQAAYAMEEYDADAGGPVLFSTPIPALIAADGLSATLTLDEVTTAAMAYIPGACSWDCYSLTTELGWKRILEGTLITIRGDAR
jgi:hypothetical protein